MKRYFSLKTGYKNRHRGTVTTYASTRTNSSIDSEISVIKKHIKTKDTTALIDHINNNFISGSVTWTETYPEYEFVFNKGFSEPFLEALFFNHPEKFCDLIQDIRATNDTYMQIAFINCVLNTDLGRKGLFSWNEAIKLNTISSIEKLKSYAEVLEGTSKAPHAKDLAGELLEKVNEGPQTQQGEQTLNSYGPEDTPSQKLNNLIFKTNLLIMAHKKDNIFHESRGWKRFSFHLIAGLCFPPFGLFTLVYKSATGNYPLFSRTTTENHVNKILKSADLDADLIPPRSIVLVR